MRAVVAAVLFAAALPAQDLLLKSHTVVVAADVTLTDGELLLRNGKVAWVGKDIPAEARGRARVLDFGAATVVPGFVVAHGWLGQERDLAELADCCTPTLPAADAFDPFQDQLAALPKAGVTSYALAPSSRNLVGGIGALVKPGRDGGAVADPDLFLMLALVAPARSQDRPPTSLMGAADLLRTMFADARADAAAGRRELQPARQVLAHSRRVFVHADTRAELRTALDLAREFSLAPVLVGGSDADQFVAELQELKADVVLTAPDYDSPPRLQQLPGVLARAGIRVAFAGRPERLRVGMALAVQHGLPRAAALQALTRTPAELLGQQQRIGSLRQGCDADFAVYGGDPIDLTSPLLAVYVDGVRLSGDADRRLPPAAARANPASPAQESR